MRHFETGLKPAAGARVLDLGGTLGIWRHVRTPLHITILNLEVEPISKAPEGRHTFELVAGDATATSYADNAFDIVFSNSVIEHVGDAASRRAFAREVRRLAPAYYVQTPSRSFPIEAHTMLPFWWYYPKSVRQLIVGKWRKKRPAYADFVDGTAAVDVGELEMLFPDGTVHLEKLAGFVKSRTVVRRA